VQGALQWAVAFGSGGLGLRVIRLCAAVTGLLMALNVGGLARATTLPDPVPSAASGQTTASDITFTFAKTPVKGRVTPDATITIVCSLKVNDPHNSHHFPGTVNVTATATCYGGVMASLSLRVYLYPPVPYATAVGPLATVAPGASISSNAATAACTAGNYQGYAYLTGTPPPGYAGKTAGGTFGPTVNINCY
jgi:hypothetical protein